MDTRETIIEENRKKAAEAIREMVRLRELVEKDRVDKLLQEFCPVIEARRSDYERIAECLAFMCEMSGDRRGYDLDITDQDFDRERNGVQLIAGIEDHFAALWSSVDWRHPAIIRRFYVDLRLSAEQLALERQRVYEAYQKEKSAQ